MSVLLQLLVNGLMLGGVYAIISVGLTLIFGIVRVVNFAHGELLMGSMYAAYLASKHLGLHPYVSALPLVLLFFAVGALIQRLVIQPLLEADSHVQIFATVGLSTALMNLALLVFGANMQSVPPSAAQGSFQLGSLRIVTTQLVMFVVSIAVIAALHVFLQRTFLGRAIRATAQNRMAAAVMGVDVKRIYVVTFGLGTACLAMAERRSSASHAGVRVAVVYFVLFLAILVTRPTGLLGLGRGSE